MYLLSVSLAPTADSTMHMPAAALGEALTAAIALMPFVQHTRTRTSASRVDIGVFVTAISRSDAGARHRELVAAVNALVAQGPWWVTTFDPP
ncbi:MAG: hypothetical protein ABIS35_01430 [Terracoccus sp.]